MLRFILCVLCLLMILPAPVKAASQDACAIWLCLPGGFPSGCSGAYSEFRDRIKHRKPPLPALSSCTVDGKTNGHYQLGHEIWEECKEDYVLREGAAGYAGVNVVGTCYLQSCAPNVSEHKNNYCEHYEAVKRIKPNYVQMWVDGDYLGQFWY